MGSQGKRYGPKFKFQVVLEALKEDRADAEVARAYEVHPVTLSRWKKEFLEKGPEVFGGQEEVREYERRISRLERMLGQKEVEIALLKNFFERELTLDERVELVREGREEFGLNACLRALGVSKGTWYYREERRRRGPDPEEEELKADVVGIIGDHPAYGRRRLKPELRARTGKVVNHKRLRRLLNEWDLSLLREVSRPEPSGVRKILKEGSGQLDLVKGWDPEPLEMLVTDFTELRYAGGSRRAQLIAFQDPESAWVPGWVVGPSARTGRSPSGPGSGCRRASRACSGPWPASSSTRTRTRSSRATTGPSAPGRGGRGGLLLGERGQGEPLDRVPVGPVQRRGERRGRSPKALAQIST